MKVRAYCKRCDRCVLAERPAVNHVFHLLMTALTCSLWLWVWLFCAMFRAPWRCPDCGGICRERWSWFRCAVGAACVAIIGVVVAAIATR